jgi:hypothetical protein
LEEVLPLTVICFQMQDARSHCLAPSE